MRKLNNGIFLVLVASLLNNACATLSPGNDVSSANVDVLYQGPFCGQHNDHVEIKRLDSTSLNDETLKSLDNGQLVSSLHQALEEGDVYWFASGMRPTPGYQLQAHFLSASHGRIKIRIDEITPPSDGFLAQVITTPCAYIGVQSDLPRQVEFVGDLEGLPIILQP